MALPGSIIEEIVNALVSAFPELEKLLEMLRFKFDIKKSDVADGVDYKNTVFKLVEKFESEGRIIKLIQKAHQQNSGNPDLEKLHKRIPEISLIEILYPRQEEYLPQMQQVYDKYFPADKLSDWEPESVEEILDNLKNIRQEEADKNPIVKFVDKLLSAKKLPGETIEQLNGWRSQNVNFWSDVGNRLKERLFLNQKENKTVLTFVLILVKPSQQLHRDNHKRYSVQAWFIRDGSNGIFNYLPSDVYESLELRCQEPNVFSWEEMPSLIGNLLRQVGSLRIPNIPIIEFFLPYELLHQPIDALIPRYEEDEEDDQALPVPIGSDYRVILRSSNRLKKTQFKHFWESKWNNLQLKEQDLCCNFFVGNNCDTWEQLRSQINSNGSFLGLRSLKIPSKEFLQTLVETGIPIALWLRNELPNENLHAEFDEMLRDCSIKELPEQIKNQRSKALGKNKNHHIGHHLSLLWENPYIIPPEALPYTTP